jgi:hypothetical protein
MFVILIRRVEADYNRNLKRRENGHRQIETGQIETGQKNKLDHKCLQQIMLSLFERFRRDISLLPL